MREHPPGNESGTPDEPGDERFAPGSSESQPTERLDASPYDEPTQAFAAEDPTEQEPPEGTDYAAAPPPPATDTAGLGGDGDEAEPEPEQGGGGRRWVIPLIILIVLLGAAAIGFALLRDGGDSPAPGASPSLRTEESATTPTQEATTGEPTEEDMTEEASEEETTEEETSTAEGELAEQLEDSVTVDDETFELSDDGMVEDEDVVDNGAVEAYQLTYTSGDTEIEMLATLWPDNELADEYADELRENFEGAEEVESDDTYTNGDGTYWAYLLEDASGSYVWTTDRGHVLQIIGPTDYAGGFFSNYPL